MRRRLLIFPVLLAGMVAGQSKYGGPRPPKPDEPFLLHATNLVALESQESKEEPRKDDALAYLTQGASSPVKTPLASPIFLLLSEKVAPEQIEIYRMQAGKTGQREIVFFKRKPDKNPRPLRLSIQKLEANLFRLEVVESLENGEYCATPRGANQVFCFQVY